MGILINTIDEPNPGKRIWWTRQLSRIFQRKTAGLRCGEEWVEFLGRMNDRQICGKYRHPKYVRYLIGFRDRALESIREEPRSNGIIIWAGGDDINVYDTGRNAEEAQYHSRYIC